MIFRSSMLTCLLISPLFWFCLFLGETEAVIIRTPESVISSDLAAMSH